MLEPLLESIEAGQGKASEPSYAVAKFAEIELKMDAYKMYDNPAAEK